MNLILTLTNPDLLPDSLRTRQIEFSKSGGTIGRSQSCDWVLEDPDRYVSSRHVAVTCKGDTFFAEDTSTNGTYLNDEVIGKGNRLALSTGDVMRVGRFNISVEQRDGDGQRIGSSTSESDDLLSGMTAAPLSSPSSSSSLDDDLLADEGDHREIDPFIGNMPLKISADDNLLGSSAPLGGVQDAMGDLPVPDGGNAIPEDWMSKADSPVPAIAKAVRVAPIKTGAPEDGDFGLVPVPADEMPSAPQGSLDAPIESLDDTPEPKPETMKKVAPKKATSKPKTKAKSKPKSKPANAKSKPAAKAKQISKAETKAKPKRKPKLKPSVTKANVTPVDTQSVAPVVAAAAPVAAARMLPEVVPVATRPVASRADVQDGSFIEGFIQSTRLHPDMATFETGAILGSVLVELLDGTLDGLDARQQMQEELRLKGTMVGARENNPLKFSINSQDAIGRLLQGEATGFKAPVPATREAMNNLSSHQLGVLNGINAGVKALLAALEPKTVAGGKTVMTGAGMVTKLSTHHAKVTEQTVERRDGVFWRAFTEAYKVAVAMAEEP